MENIYLSLSKKYQYLPLGTEIIIVPSSDRWNDFGFRVRIEVGVVSENSQEISWLPAYLAIKDKLDTTQYIRELFKELKKNELELIPFKRIGLPYALLLFESQQYSLMRNLIGSDNSKKLLESLNDVSVLASQQKKISGWEDFFESEVFTEAMTRASESYFAYRRGADVLDSNDWYEDDVQKNFNVKLVGEGPKFEFNFNFDSSNHLRGRIAVIVGKNGLGKTESLRKLAGAFAGSDVKYAQISRDLSFNQVLAFSHVGHKKLRKRKNKNIRSAAVRQFTFNPKIERIQHRDGFARLLVDIARTFDDHGRPFLFLYKDILEQELGHLTVYVPMKNDSEDAYADSKGRKYLSLSKWMRAGGEQIKLQRISGVDFSRNLIYLDADHKPRKLSTGQHAFLQFSLNALANAGPASVFLIDEPENFLHPNLISQFMRLLNQILKATKSIAIIATHSPFVVREVQSEQVHVLDFDPESGVTRVLKPRLQTLGANISSISTEVFGDELPDHLMQEILEIVDDSNSFESLLDKYGCEMSVEALMKIRKIRAFE